MLINDLIKMKKREINLLSFTFLMLHTIFNESFSEYKLTLNFLILFIPLLCTLGKYCFLSKLMRSSKLCGKYACNESRKSFHCGQIQPCKLGKLSHIYPREREEKIGGKIRYKVDAEYGNPMPISILLHL
jgi:hypothetical protein